ncbi:MAG: ATP-dependent sacrificial sulfur transferase LarE, partial [Candidatus Edwardsbacteria bacterium]|nr:ATP-dependent sacrificial sulfur transferase LarE [Candidatus Edwardsbacteria bacterium]
MGLNDKEKKLAALLRGYGSVMVAYSGGIDSTFLAVMAKKVLGENHLAMTAVSAIRSENETKTARTIAKRFKLNHLVIKTDELKNKIFLSNPADRCYYCKSILWREMKKIARAKDITTIIEGSTADDLKEYRPGKAASIKCGIRSPLAEAGLTKTEIRSLAKKMGLPNWNAPSNSCLATRIPYGRTIKVSELRRIGSSETFLKKIGFGNLRVRHHGYLARIEVPAEEIPAMIKRSSNIVKKLKGLGYKFVTLDLAGYQKGCYDDGKKNAKRK